MTWPLRTLLIVMAGLALVVAGKRPAGAAPPDACEIACGPVFTQCLIDAGTSPATPDPRIERECRKYTEAVCIRPCRRGK